MKHHRLSLYAGLALLQLPLLGCPQGSFSETSDSTGTTTPIEDDTTFGHIQTVTGDVPTTGVTTGENDTDPGQSALDESCTNCGNPETVQVCFCVDNSGAEPVFVEKSYACLGDATLEPTAAQSCTVLLNKQELSAEDFHCMHQIMCPTADSENRLEDQCNLCGGPEVEQFYCVSDDDALAFDKYACVDDPVAESTARTQCAAALGKTEAQLTDANFFHTINPCPGGETTGGATTGDTTTGDSTTGGTTTGDATSGTATAGDETTGDTTSAGSTAGSDTTNGETSGGDSTGGVAPLVGCAAWNPAAAVTYGGHVYYVDINTVTSLVADSTPLLDCDDARLIERTSGGYEIQQSSPGDLLHELGLRNGDVPLSLNGYGLEDSSAVLFAFVQLWFIEEQSEYQLLVSRAGRSYTLRYQLTN